MRIVLVLVLANVSLVGCALAVGPPGGGARDSGAADTPAILHDAVAIDAGAPVADATASPCGTLSCCIPTDRQQHVLPGDKSCRVDNDCVVRAFAYSTNGTLEIAAVSVASVAAFDEQAAHCTCSMGVPPGLPFFEADGGTLPPGLYSGIQILDSGVAVARCLAGCCTAVRATATDAGRD